MSSKHATAGRALRRYVRALLDANEHPSEASAGGVPGYDPDLAQDALIRLVAKARRPGGEAWLTSLLPRTDEQLGRLFSRLVRHAAAEQSPERAYYRALRLHVEEILRIAGDWPARVRAPTGLQMQGRIDRRRVENGLAILIREMGTQPDQYAVTLAAFGTRPDVVSSLTRQLTKLYPPEGVVMRGTPQVPGQPTVDRAALVPDPNTEGRAKELEFWRNRFAPKTAAEIALLLGDDFRLVVAQLRGATLEDISKITGIPRATIADRIKRSVEVLKSARHNLGSYGTFTSAIQLLITGTSDYLADKSAAIEAQELVCFLEEGKKGLVPGRPRRESPT